MNRKWIAVALGLLFLVLAFLIMIDHYQLTGIWFQPEDLHHETFILSAAAAGVGILISTIIIGNGPNSNKTKTAC